MSVILQVLVFAFGYFLVGVLVTYLLWKDYVQTELMYYREQRKRFLQQAKILEEEVPQFILGNWQRLVASDERLQRCPPRLVDHPFRISLALVIWPIAGMVWSVTATWEQFREPQWKSRLWKRGSVEKEIRQSIQSDQRTALP